MVRFVNILIVSLFLCYEIKANQITKSEYFNYDTIKFDTVSKNLIDEFGLDTPDNKKLSEIVQYWFDNRIKTNGFDGILDIKLKDVLFNRQKTNNYYRLSIVLSLEFIIKKNLNSKKIINIKSNEYGEIKGSFSINDQESLDISVMHNSLKSISIKLKEII